MLYLSIGHHPKAKGSAWKEYTEFDCASAWMPTIMDYFLINTDISPILVPSTIIPLKVAFINKNFTIQNLVVELHFNSQATVRRYGFETLFKPGSKLGESLANTMQREYAKLNPNLNNKGVRPCAYDKEFKQLKDFPITTEEDERLDYFMKKANCPVLIFKPHYIYELTLEDFNHTEQAIKVAKTIAATYKEFLNGR